MLATSQLLDLEGVKVAGDDVFAGYRVSIRPWMEIVRTHN
jgi:hypothetical protein